jgi:hypothetical protein
MTFRSCQPRLPISVYLHVLCYQMLVLARHPFHEYDLSGRVNPKRLAITLPLVLLKVLSLLEDFLVDLIAVDWRIIIFSKENN